MEWGDPGAPSPAAPLAVKPGGSRQLPCVPLSHAVSLCSSSPPWGQSQARSLAGLPAAPGGTSSCPVPSTGGEGAGGGGEAGALDVCQQRCRRGGLRFRGDIMCGKRDTAWTPPSSPPPASSCALVAQGAVSPAGPGNGSGAWGRACTCAPLALLHHWPRRMRGTAKVCHPPGAPRAGSALPLCTSNKGTHGSSLGCPQTQPLAGKGWLLPSFICRP